MIDQKLFDAFAGVAGALDTKTITAVLNDLEGWVGPDIEACRQAFAMRRQLREPLDFKRRDYYVRGRYIALYDDGSESGEISISIIQPAADADAAVQQVARDAAEEHGYKAIAWLSIASDLVEDGQP